MAPQLVRDPSGSVVGVSLTIGSGPPRYRNLHAADEAVELRTIGPVYEIYHKAVTQLLQRSL